MHQVFPEEHPNQVVLMRQGDRDKRRARRGRTASQARGSGYDVTAIARGDVFMLRTATDQSRSREVGFTLLELMVVMAIIAIIAAIAIPSYKQYIRKSHRADALQRMQQITLAQERFRAENPGYTTDWTRLGGDPDTTTPNGIGAWFDWADVTTTAGPPATFSISVTAQGDQQKDKAGSTACTTLTLNSAGTRTPAACWAN